MKTQIDKVRAEQALTNKIITISILIIGSILFTVSGKNFWNEVFSERNVSITLLDMNKVNTTFIPTGKDESTRIQEHSTSEYIAQLEVCCSDYVNHELEAESSEQQMGSKKETLIYSAQMQVTNAR